MSAVGAPTRVLWVLLVMPYTLMFAAFGWGVLRVASENHRLRVAGALIIIFSVFTPLIIVSCENVIVLLVGLGSQAVNKTAIIALTSTCLKGSIRETVWSTSRKYRDWQPK